VKSNKAAAPQKALGFKCKQDRDRLLHLFALVHCLLPLRRLLTPEKTNWLKTAMMTIRQWRRQTRQLRPNRQFLWEIRFRVSEFASTASQVLQNPVPMQSRH